VREGATLQGYWAVNITFVERSVDVKPLTAARWEAPSKAQASNHRARLSHRRPHVQDENFCGHPLPPCVGPNFGTGAAGRRVCVSEKTLLRRSVSPLVLFCFPYDHWQTLVRS
jgi:hypothetical protein